ncbi:MAG: hypothetical protein HOI23_07915 [Deltaproteobacteria bacterium]|nr:hypothetical protein [Deltaproteobacteria bacterium]MBT6435746.1 hypothetical protein [Deltaproteobacteria bacterium]MBT6489265.1 hypothetical protein [Deltaproteobacteria bacterium]
MGDELNNSAEETGAAQGAGTTAYLQAAQKKKLTQEKLIEMVLKASIQ